MVGPPNYLELLGRIGRAAGTPRPDVQATLFLEAYAWRLAGPAVEALLSGGAQPSILPDAVEVSFGPDGRPAEVRFAARDRVPSVERLRRELEQHLRPLIDRLVDISRRPEGALWRSAGDCLAQAFCWYGDELGLPERARQLGERAMAIPGPMQGRAGYRVEGGRLERRRNGCCLWWRTSEGITCPGCPLGSPPPRGRPVASARSA